MTDLIKHPLGTKLPVNNDLAGLVPLATETEQVSLTKDINANGLNEPVILYKGEIVDGRCRQIACTITGTQIRSKELDPELTIEQVKVYVQSVNTRRNLTHTQKTMIAAKISAKDKKSTVTQLAEVWGVSPALIANGKYILKQNKKIGEILFNGRAVAIVNARDENTTTLKVSAVYAHLKRLEEGVAEDTKYEEHGWLELSAIRTQAGKDWYYGKVKENNVTDVTVRKDYVELANYKFKGGK